MMRFLEIKGPSCREILHHPLPKATHVCYKKKKKGKKPELEEKAHLHQRNQFFPIAIMETVLNWVLLASL